MSLLWFLLVGLAAGYLATAVMKKEGYGLWGNLGIGVVGAYLGSFLIGWIINEANLIGQLISAFVGAMALLWIIDWFKNKK